MNVGRRLCTEYVKYIRLTAAYLTTVRQVIINYNYLHMKRLVASIKMLIFYRAMLCIRDTSHKPVSVSLSVTQKSVFY